MGQELKREVPGEVLDRGDVIERVLQALVRGTR